LINLSSVESAANISKVKNLRDGGVMLGCVSLKVLSKQVIRVLPIVLVHRKILCFCAIFVKFHLIYSSFNQIGFIPEFFDKKN
jgi:hypothetical protein